MKVQLRGLKKILKNLRGLKKILKILRGLKKFDYIRKNAPSGYPAEKMTGPLENEQKKVIYVKNEK